jgi:hypothetical protein
MCPCGCPLDQPHTGRPRRYCCDWCRYRAADAQRLIGRRDAWVADWRELLAAGLVGPDEANQAIALCQGDIDEASRRIHGATPNGDTLQSLQVAIERHGQRGQGRALRFG